MVTKKRKSKKSKKNVIKKKKIVITNKMIQKMVQPNVPRYYPKLNKTYSGGSSSAGGSSSSSSSAPGFYIQQPQPFPPRAPDQNKFLFEQSIIDSFDNSNKNLTRILNRLQNMNISQEVVNGILQVNLDRDNDDTISYSEMSSLTNPSSMDVTLKNENNPPPSFDPENAGISVQEPELEYKDMDIESIKDEKKPKNENILLANQQFESRIPIPTTLGKRRAVPGQNLLDENENDVSMLDNASVDKKLTQIETARILNNRQPQISETVTNINTPMFEPDDTIIGESRNIHEVVADRTRQARERGDIASVDSSV